MNNHKLCQFIIKKYIKQNINWPREIKIAQKLIKKFTEFKFWNALDELKSSPPSLAWFLKPQGKLFLIKEYGKFKIYLNKDTPILSPKKLDKDKDIKFKIKTAKDFIKYGSGKI